MGPQGRPLAWFAHPRPPEGEVRLRPTRHPHRGRWVGLAIAIIAVLCIAPAIGAAYIFNRIGEGPIELNWMSGPLASGISSRLGEPYSVEIGPIVLEDSDHGPRLVISGFTLKGENDRAILVSPKAEVAINPLPLIFGRISARRLEIADVELRLSVLADGSVALSAGLEPIVLADRRAPVPVTDPISPAPAKADVMAQLGAALRKVLDTATSENSPVRALKRLGITRGRLVFDDQTARHTTVFDGLQLEFDRASETADFYLSANGPAGRWRVQASASGKPGAPRALDISLDNLSIDELLLVAGQRDPGFDMTMPLSSRLNVAMAADGRIARADGSFSTGSGFITLDDPDHEPMQVDEIRGSFEWKGDVRRFEFGRTTLKLGETQLAVAGSLTPPRQGDHMWSFDGRTFERGVFGVERAGQKPITVERASMAGHVLVNERRLIVDRFEIVGPEVALGATVDLQLTDKGPHLKFKGTAGHMPATNVVRLWPSPVASSARGWFQRALLSGMLDEGQADIDFDPDTMAALKQDVSPPDDTMRVTFRLSNASVIAMAGLPPLSNLDGTGVVTGRTSNFLATRGLMQVTPTQKLLLAEGSVAVADSNLHPTPATINLRMNGPLDAVADLFDRDVLKPYAQLPIDATTVKGHIDGRMVIDLKLGSEMASDDTRVRASAALSNFTVDRLVGKEKLEAGNLTLTAERGTLYASGQGRLFGAPATIELRKAVNQPTETTLGMFLDDGARTKLGLNFGSALTGQIGAKLTSVLGQKEKSRAQVEIDFTKAAIDNLLPGYTKLAGKPAKASFTLVNDPEGPDLENFTFDGGGGAMAKGLIELDPNGGLERVKLSPVRLSPGDDMSITAEQTANNLLKLSITGKSVDAKPFLKLLTTGAPAGARSGPAKDFDVDVKAATVTGHNKQSGTNVELKMSRRNGLIRTFQLSGRVGRDAIAGSMARPAPGQPPQVMITSNDAGAVLNFFDLYRRMEGGRLNFVASLADGELDGTVNVRDFIVRNEPALRRLVTEGVAARDRSGQIRIDTTAAAFSRMQVSFTRSQGMIELRDGVINGPEAGTTIEGTLDTLNDRVNMTGTFVPAYGLNNMFAKIPVVGIFLGGGSNEGLFGVNFRISGPATAPMLTINPLSALAPGFLRKIFGAGEIGTSQMPQPPAAVPEPQPPANGNAPMQYAPARRSYFPFGK